ncbi:hypothetical protein C8J56DRAFT_1166483 [Mycena floridula]|nr:hypothetical protein C8J56DRAFT_1166483 [Mycena floridula]
MSVAPTALGLLYHIVVIASAPVSMELNACRAGLTCVNTADGTLGLSRRQWVTFPDENHQTLISSSGGVRSGLRYLSNGVPFRGRIQLRCDQFEIAIYELTKITVILPRRNEWKSKFFDASSNILLWDHIDRLLLCGPHCIWNPASLLSGSSVLLYGKLMIRALTDIAISAVPIYSYKIFKTGFKKTADVINRLLCPLGGWERVCDTTASPNQYLRHRRCYYSPRLLIYMHLHGILPAHGPILHEYLARYTEFQGALPLDMRSVSLKLEWTGWKETVSLVRPYQLESTIQAHMTPIRSISQKTPSHIHVIAMNHQKCQRSAYVFSP